MFLTKLLEYYKINAVYSIYSNKDIMNEFLFEFL